MTARRVIICGGRDYDDEALVADLVSSLPRDTIIITGEAPGADALASHAALRFARDQIKVPANWARHGRSAGPIRNRLMLSLGVDEVIAFPGGNGTADMIAAAEKAGVPVRRIPEGVAGTREG